MKIRFDAELKSFELVDGGKVKVSFALSGAFVEEPEVGSFDTTYAEPLQMTVSKKVMAPLKLGQRFKITVDSESR
jgi:hypothetical protein